MPVGIPLFPFGRILRRLFGPAQSRFCPGGGGGAEEEEENRSFLANGLNTCVGH